MKNEMNRDLREQQRELDEFVQRNEEDLVKGKPEALTYVIEKLSDQANKVKNTRDASYDSSLFLKVSVLNNRHISHIGQEDLRVNWGTHWENLVKQHPNKSNDDNSLELDFVSLGKMCSVFFSDIRNKNFMFGAVEIDQKEKKKMNTGPKPSKEIHHEQKAQEVVNNEKKVHEKSSHEIMQDLILSKLKEQYKKSQVWRQHKSKSGIKKRSNNSDDVDPCNYFKLLVNPASFTQTVENMFEFSFLINDAWAGIQIDDQGNLLAVPTDPTKVGNNNNVPTPERISSILSMTPQDFRLILNKYGLQGKESVIPHRNGPEYEKDFVMKNIDDDLKKV